MTNSKAVRYEVEIPDLLSAILGVHTVIDGTVPAA